MQMANSRQMHMQKSSSWIFLFFSGTPQYLMNDLSFFPSAILDISNSPVKPIHITSCITSFFFSVFFVTTTSTNLRQIFIYVNCYFFPYVHLKRKCVRKNYNGQNKGFLLSTYLTYSKKTLYSKRNEQS